MTAMMTTHKNTILPGKPPMRSIQSQNRTNGATSSSTAVSSHKVTLACPAGWPHRSLRREKNPLKYSSPLVIVPARYERADSTAAFAAARRNRGFFGTVGVRTCQIKKAGTESLTRKGEA